MTSAAWKAADILGLTPGLDLRRSDKVFAIGGKNFAFTSKGPRSVFGDRFLLPHPLGKPNHAQGVKIRLRAGDRTFTFEGNTILEWDETAGGWQVLFVTPLTNLDPYRWTTAYLNGYVYFCHPRTGIIVYNLDNGEVFKHNGPGVPTAPLAICANNGRLCVLDDLYFSWSWQSDGLNFAPALGEAGQQLVSDRVSGFPIMINTYAQGVLIWTTGGVMRSEFTGDQEVYRHRNMNTEFRPINSFCTIQLDDNTIVILDERGLFQSQGGAPEPLAPMFNEFLMEYIRQNNLTLGQNVRIEWNDARRFLYLSLSISENSPIYERAFVLYPSLDKWGTFDIQHHGIIPIGIAGNQRGGQYYGFVGADGRVRFWSDFASRETLPTSPTLNLRYPVIQKPSFVEEGGGCWISGSSMTLNSEPQLPMSAPAGFYANESNTPATAERVGLDAKLQVGLIRMDQADSFDRMTEVISIMLGNVESGPEAQLSEDYLTVPPGVDDEDYNAIEGAEDFGEDSLAYVNHNLRIISTIDGRSVFMQAVPDMIQFTEAARHYSCSSVGIWHILEVSADSPGQAFHLRAFELNATDAGRLS